MKKLFIVFGLSIFVFLNFNCLSQIDSGKVLIVKFDTIIGNLKVQKRLKIDTSLWENTIHKKGLWVYKNKKGNLSMNIIFSEKSEMTTEERRINKCSKISDKNESLEQYIKRIHDRYFNELLIGASIDTSSAEGVLSYSFKDRCIKLVKKEINDKTTRYNVTVLLINKDGVSFNILFWGSGKNSEELITMIDIEIQNILESLELFDDSFTKK